MANESFGRKVKSIVDGDTFTISKAIYGKNYVRLANVDTPEKGNAEYMKAKRQLQGMIGGKTVTIKPVNVKRRVIAEVYADGKSVNKRMRERGWQ